MYHQWQSYDIWFLRHRLQQIFFVILGHFLPFYPPPHPSNSTKNQNFIKWNKNTLRYIILHKCTKKHYHILYCSWDMACDTCNFYFSFYAIFCILTPLTAQKIKMKKNEKKCLEISSFYTSVPKIIIICYTVPEIWHVTDAIVIFHFGLSPNNPKNEKKKKPGDIIILQKCTNNHDHRLYCSWDMVRNRCNCYFSFLAIFCPLTP